jgi:LmbE family N-acetylglucosaminyl deacetylase
VHGPIIQGDRRSSLKGTLKNCQDGNLSSSSQALSPRSLHMQESDFMPYTAATTVGTAPSLVLAPHPDDEVLGCAGAILSHVAAGDDVDVLILTDGVRGIVEPALSDDAIRNIRMEESKCAAAVLAYGQPQFWRYPDRELVCDEGLIRRIHDFIASNSYRSVFAPSPLEIHPDHRNLAHACLEAATRSDRAFELCFYEVGQPLYPNLLLDISAYIQTKQRAAACFESQLNCQNYHLQSEGLNRFRSYTLPKTVSHAEAYAVITSTQAQEAADILRKTGLLPLGRKDLDEAFTQLRNHLHQQQLELERLQSQLEMLRQSRARTAASALRRLTRRLFHRRGER